jgi:hypothetical protein
MLAGFLLIRVAILGNPVSWEVYSRVLDAGVVGWRQYDLVRIQRDSYMQPRAGLRYLAVGSSQTEAVYARYARQHDDFDTLIVAAMMPMDFVLYANEVVRRRPATVLLYLSDFDIAKRPSAEAMVLAPSQGAGLATFLRQFHAQPMNDELQRAAFELAVGEVLPEFKFRYVFRGLLDRCLRRVADALGSRDRAHGRRSTVEERANSLRDSLGVQYVGGNLAWLEEFLGIVTSHGIEVVIVEGHYHPAVSNTKTTLLSSTVRSRLEQLAGAHIRYVPQSVLGGLTAADYSDLTHVEPEAGDRLVHRLVAILEQASAAGPAAARDSPLVSVGSPRVARFHKMGRLAGAIPDHGL